MNRPPLLTYALGNWVVMPGLVLLGLATGYGWLEGQMAGGATLIALVLMSAAIKANERLRTYRRWKLEWDSMGGEQGPPSAAGRNAARGFAMVFFALMLLYGLSKANDPLIRGTLIYTVGGFICLGIYVLVKRKKRATPVQSKDAIVTISIVHPLMDIPPLEVAYRQLPPHCARLLTRSPAPRGGDPQDRR